jgi:hypothetical protein
MGKKPNGKSRLIYETQTSARNRVYLPARGNYYLRVHRPSAKQRTAEGLALLEQSQHVFSAAQYQAAERSSRQAVKIFRGLAREFPQHRYYPQHLGHSLWALSDALSATEKKG